MPPLMPARCENKENSSVRERKFTKSLKHNLHEEKKTMKSQLFNISLKAGRINQQHVRVALAIGALVLFVLGAGAPCGSGAC